MSAANKDVLDLLDSLDTAPVAHSKAPKSTAATPTAAPGDGEAAEALAFLDELTQQKSRPTRVLTPGPRVRNATTDSVRKSVDSVRNAAVAGTPPRATTPLASSSSAPVQASSSGLASGSGGGWGWGSVWNTASTIAATAAQAAAQAKTVVDEQVKHLPANDQAKKWGEGMYEYVKNAQLDKLSKPPSHHSNKRNAHIVHQARI